MKLAIYEFQCGNCNSLYQHRNLCPYLYGEFILRSKNGTERYLNALNNPVYAEVDKLLENFSEYSGANRDRQADLLQEIFGISCDPDESGDYFSMNTDPICPTCNAQNAYSWKVVESVSGVEVDLPHVTHKIWNRLDKHEKIKKLFQKLNSLDSH